ncbi:Uncharacterised protein [Mycobacteroides abscessus subsp. abscessus]|nr:Uncharacterised protein [Mycobacteroides abscessus subsp. abscessus]
MICHINELVLLLSVLLVGKMHKVRKQLEGIQTLSQ